MSFSRALQAEQAISTFKEKAPRTPQEESMSLTAGQWGSGVSYVHRHNNPYCQQHSASSKESLSAWRDLIPPPCHQNKKTAVIKDTAVEEARVHNG